MKAINKILVENRYFQKFLKKKIAANAYPTEKENEFIVSKFSLKNLNKERIPYKLIQEFELYETPVEIIHPAHSYFFEPPTLEAFHECAAFMLSKNRNKKVRVTYEGRFTDAQLVPGPNYFYLDRPNGSRSYLWKVLKQNEKVKGITELFPALSRLIKDPKTRVVISFGSGGIRLYAHPSIMKFFNIMGYRDYIQEIWGCSGGAIAGLPYSLGISPELIEEEGYHLYNDRYSINFNPNVTKVIKNLFWDNFFPNSENTLRGFMDCQDDLTQMFEKHLIKTNRKGNKIPFYCLAYNIKARRLEILTPDKVKKIDYPTPILQTKAMEAVVASSAIPILFIPKKILRGKTEHVYVDGGTIEEVPLLSVYQKWKADVRNKIEDRSKLLIICVNLFPHFAESHFFQNWLFKRLPTSKIFHFFAKYTDMVRDGRIVEHKKLIEQDKRVKVVELILHSKDSAVLDPLMIPKVIKLAQKDFFEQLMAIESQLKNGKRPGSSMRSI